MQSVATVQTSPVNIEERKNLPFSAGDTVRVWVKVEEKGKTRLQPFEGIVLARKHGSEPGATFTVRRVSGGFGVEKIFPLYSPNIDRIEVLRHVDTRRSKLYHIRDKAARAIKRQMRKMNLVSIATVSEAEEKARMEKEEAEAQERQQAEQTQNTDATPENTEQTPTEESTPETSEQPAENQEESQTQAEEKEA